MEIQTVLLIILAAIVALTVVFFQYFHKNPRKGSQKIILAALRFLAVFGALLLLINPQFVKQDYFVEKSNLVVLVDESSSMAQSVDSTEISELLALLVSNPDMEDRFDIQKYGFAEQLSLLDSISFNDRNTNISKALTGIGEVFGKSHKTIVLLTDGNQTLGRDYAHLNLNGNAIVHPFVVGDTTHYEDILVSRVNTNKYAFLNNKFPVEAQLVYTGDREVSRQVSVVMDGKTVHRESVRFNAAKNSQTINALIEAQSVGVKSLQIRAQALENERNTSNNTRETAIEVIDEKTKIAIVASLMHPDIGALKKSIETNEQRTVVLLKPEDAEEEFQDVGLFILYQPNRRFKNVYDYIERVGGNKFTIAGTQTDWLFVNQVQNSFFKERLNQREELLPVLNKGFGVFGLGEFSVDGFPPLQGQLGDIDFKKETETIMFQRIRGVDLETPLFALLTEGNRREAVLFGENIWRWRAQNFRNSQNFSDFDNFVGKLMVYLSNSDRRSRLELDYDIVFDGSSLARIRASYYDESYGFDSNASLRIEITGTENGFTREAPLVFKGSFYEVDLSDLQAGEYTFTVTVLDDNVKKSGSFKILDFNPENQVLSSNFAQLSQLAENNNGNLYFPDQMDALISELSNSQRYAPVQKSRQNVVSLIDFKVLLGIIALALSMEWFIRKYNGLI
ncbi:VWA domain-containing protein [Flagellimonas myxillae]|uniref:VWA domain-containing protein n=1 Tax=Flagellimonas myxillae TaxID=2942214 RepID=UPI00201E90E5|nr:VWA domain-containing protein [Muricauda myxillae]MCL6266022.1 VWA domain-containing protein [Muricauda myxillae]